MSVEKFWDLNIFFEDLGHDENGENQWADIITINPVVYHQDHDNNSSWNHYTDKVYKSTFAEARYIRSVRPIEEYGDDWTESLEMFLEDGPPRLVALLKDLPDVYSEEAYKLAG